MAGFNIDVSSLVDMRVDTTEVQDLIEDIQSVENQIPAYLSEAMPQIEATLSNMMLTVYYEAASVANFPIPYVTHMAEGVRTLLRPSVTFDGTELYVVIPDLESLGSEELLAEASHYHAIAALTDKKDFSVSNPRLVPIGSNEGELYERSGENAGADTEIRTEYFEAMMRGESVWIINLGRGKNAHSMAVTIPDKNETFYERTTFWGSQYPEWFLLEYGDSALGISPGGFMVTFELVAEEYITRLIESLADKIVISIEEDRQLRFEEGTRVEVLDSGQVIARRPSGQFGRQYR